MARLVLVFGVVVGALLQTTCSQQVKGHYSGTYQQRSGSQSSGYQDSQHQASTYEHRVHFGGGAQGGVDQGQSGGYQGGVDQSGGYQQSGSQGGSQRTGSSGVAVNLGANSGGGGRLAVQVGRGQSSGQGSVAVQTGRGQSHSGGSVAPAVGGAHGSVQYNAGNVQSSAHPTVRVFDDQELCSDCEIRNGVGYRGHPTDCNKYTQCFLTDANQWRAVVRSCPAGLFWDQSKLTCNRPNTVSCGQDRCAGFPTGRNFYSDSCRGYWNCRDGRTDDLDWCGPFQSFNDDTDDCDDDRSCVDDDDEDETITVTAPCHFEEHETDDDKYYVYEWGLRRQMGCPPGTSFTWDKCGCGSILHGYGAGCRPELYLPFDDDFSDKSGGNWVDNRGCHIRAVAGANGGRAAYFDGNCEVIVPRFTAHDFGSRVLISLRYKEDEDDRRTRLQALVSNGDCSKVPSILIAFDNEGDSTKGILRTGARGEYVTQNAQARGVWKEVEYEYDGESFILRTNGNSDGMVARGNVRVVQAALHIGDGAGLANFKGYIDDVKVYLCKP